MKEKLLMLFSVHKRIPHPDTINRNQINYYYSIYLRIVGFGALLYEHNANNNNSRSCRLNEVKFN